MLNQFAKTGQNLLKLCRRWHSKTPGRRDWNIKTDNPAHAKYPLFRRGEVFYIQDSTTGKQTSLRTKDKTEASRDGVQHILTRHVKAACEKCPSLKSKPVRRTFCVAARRWTRCKTAWIVRSSRCGWGASPWTPRKSVSMPVSN